ncbi:MAG: efflux RND transporter periplasmic adaptor subunit [Chitinophagales bacterium]|nr:efflux RND transporter periplasmic adaptor subunit [Chitinophagales bacterium]
MSKGKLVFVALILSTVVGLGYVKYKKVQEAKAKMPMPGKGGPQTLMASGYVVQYSVLSNDLDANGTILAQDVVQLQPEVSGRVTYLKIDEGAFVQKGTLLLKVNDAELQAQIQKLKAQKVIATANKERLAELLKINGVSKSEYDAAENQLNNIVADIQLLEVQIEKTSIRAPFSGKLGLRNISLGAYVTPATVVASLQNTAQLKIDVTMPEKYASVVFPGNMMACKVAGFDQVFSAKIIAIEPNIDEKTRNLKVRAVILNPVAKLLPGAYVKVSLKLNATPQALMIPGSAIIPDDKATKVVISENGKAKFVFIETGVRTSGEVQVTSGLKVGDTVLTSGLLQVKPDMDVKITQVAKTSNQ